MSRAPDKPNPAIAGPGWVRNAWRRVALNLYPHRLAFATLCGPLSPESMVGAGLGAAMLWGGWR